MRANNPYFIGITGGSASGKTTFLRNLAKAFGSDELCIVSQDNYYKPAEEQLKDDNGHINFDLPSCIDFDRFVNDLEDLKNGKSITKKEYTFSNQNKEPEIITVNPAPIIVIEGLFIFYHQEIFNRLQLKIFIDADEQIKFERRIKRDIDERGIAHDMIVYQWNNHVKPAYESFLLPYIHQTDMVILNNNGFNKGFEVVADHIYNLLNQRKSSV